MVDPDGTIGARARAIRRRRGLSLDTAAALAGISKSYLSKLENGKKRFDRRGLLDALAGALSCSTADLTGQPYLPHDHKTAEAAAALPSIARAVYDCDLDDVPDVPARPVEQLVSAAARANAYLDDARFSLAVRGLDALLLELQVHAVTGNGDTRRVALSGLAEACMVGTAVARHLGRPELALQTARRGYDAARRLDDAALCGQLAVQRALGLSWIGAHRKLSTVLDDALAEVDPIADPSADDTGPAEAAGLLHLTAAWHCAQQGRAGDVDTHLTEARNLAARTGERNALRMHFGPSSVTLWELETAAELERGLAAAEKIRDDVPRLLDTLDSPNRRCVLHFDLARAYAQAEGARDGEAIRHLDAADRVAPQGIRNVPIARELLGDLDARARRRVWELDSLRNRFGVG